MSSFIVMASATLHLQGVSYDALTRRSLHHQAQWSQRTNYMVSVGFSFRLYRTINDSCKTRNLRVCCDGRVLDVLERNETENQSWGGVPGQLTCVMKFGGSSVGSAERMREVAELILSFPEEKPVIVLSAMGKTTNKLLQVSMLPLFTLITFPLVLSIMSSGRNRLRLLLGWGEGCQLWCFLCILYR